MCFCCREGQLTLRRDTIEAVLSLATLWKLDDIVRACCGYLGDNIRPTTCIGLLNFATFNNCRALHAAAYSYLVVSTGCLFVCGERNEDSGTPANILHV